MVGPLIGAGLYYFFGYEKTMDINVFFELFLVVVFGVFNCGFKVYANEKRLIETIKKLREIGNNRTKTLAEDESEIFEEMERSANTET